MPTAPSNAWFLTHCTAALLLITAQSSRGALLFYDAFNYTVGTELGEEGSDSRPPWDNDKSNITIASGTLTYPGLQAASGQRVNVNGGSSNLDGTRTIDGTWPAQTNGTLYFSFLLRVDSTAGIAASGNGTPIVNICEPGSATKQLISINLLNSGGVKVGVVKYPSSTSATSSAFFNSGVGALLTTDGTVTYLVVAKYEWVDGAANDVVTVWVNPSNLGTAENALNLVSTSAGTDGTGSGGRFFINRGPLLNIDELRIGQSWAEVTPTSGPVVQPQPHITESFPSPGGFVLRGTNGTPTAGYRVLRTEDPGVSPALWTPVATNLFDASGNFDSTNPAPASASQAFYLLALGGTPQVAPSITTQPGDSTVLIGQNAGFTVIANGTAPLHYQWLFEGSPISGANASLLTVANVQTTNAGGYSVIITNNAGSITSLVATLTVIPVPATGTPDGYATVGSGTTGGAGGPVVIVDNFADFDFYADNHSGPFIILVQGTINLGGSNVRARDNKTIIGIGTNATLVGNLKVFGNNNVIIQNITFTNPSGVGDGDGLTLHECLNVWVDHCTFVDCDDGTLDMAHAADWVTVSWCHFYYTNPANTHRFSNLVGHSEDNGDQDRGKLHVTFHHNWWGALVHERMPRVRFGRVHCYNNYYNAPGNNYCVRVALECEVLMENNYFKNVDQPWEYFTNAGEIAGKIRSLGDEFDNVTGLIPATDTLSPALNGLNPPPYAPYTLDAAAGVPNAVTNNAGAGKGPFAP